MSEYTPTEADVRGIYVEYYMRHTGRLHSHTEAEFDAWLARVRRDAAREALDGLAARFEAMGDGADQADQWAWEWHAQDEVETYRDTHYPIAEETEHDD